MIAYTIINNANDVGNSYSLCGDMVFRYVTSSGFGKTDTLLYKSLPAAKKRLAKVSKTKFPHAAIVAHQGVNEIFGNATWIIRRDEDGTGPLRA